MTKKKEEKKEKRKKRVLYSIDDLVLSKKFLYFFLLSALFFLLFFFDRGSNCQPITNLIRSKQRKKERKIKGWRREGKILTLLFVASIIN